MVELQLRQAREARGLSIEELARRTGMQIRLLAAVDRGDWKSLPTGLYGRAAVRAYARAVGLDPAALLHDIADDLPVAEDPLDGLARVRGFARRARGRQERPAARDVGAPSAGDLFEPTGFGAHPSASTGTERWRAAAATAIDGAVLAASGALLIVSSARAAGSPWSAMLSEAGGPLALIVLLIVAFYFVLLGGVRQETLGATVSGWKGTREEGRDAHAILVRAAECALRASSIAVDWLVRAPRPARMATSLWQLVNGTGRN